MGKGNVWAIIISPLALPGAAMHDAFTAAGPDATRAIASGALKVANSGPANNKPTLPILNAEAATAGIDTRPVDISSNSQIAANRNNDAALAQQISATCTGDPLYKNLEGQCQGNPPAQSACYRAASQLCQCFLNNDTRPLTPAIQQTHAQWQQCVSDNRASANSLK
jgi:hypothetical protein